MSSLFSLLLLLPVVVVVSVAAAVVVVFVVVALVVVVVVVAVVVPETIKEQWSAPSLQGTLSVPGASSSVWRQFLRARHVDCRQ